MALACLILFIRLQRVNYNQKMAKRMLSQQQSSDYQVASGDLVSSPLAAALDPRVDEDLVQQQMRDDTGAGSESVPEQSAATIDTADGCLPGPADDNVAGQHTTQLKPD